MARMLVGTAVGALSNCSTITGFPLQEQVDELPMRKGRLWMAPVLGQRYTFSAAHIREANDGNLLAREWK